jgi:predicted dehydrogenase
MTRALNWGLLGTARINRAVIPALRASTRNRLAAVGSRTPERAATYAAEWDIPRHHGTYEGLLADPEVDVVYVSLPNALHAEWTIRAVQAGKHVLCEKPLAISVEEVDAVTRAATGKGRVVAEAFMYRHHPQTEQVCDRVAKGDLGRLRLIRGSFSFTLSRPRDVRLDPSLGGGSLWDVGCYPLSYARTLLGHEPIEAFGRRRDGPSGVDMTFAAQLLFPDGVIVQFDCSFETPFRAVLEIVGKDACLTVTEPFKPGPEARLLFLDKDGTRAVPVPQVELYAGEVEDLASAILDGTPPRVSLADSRANVAAIVALLRSAREGRPLPVA